MINMCEVKIGIDFEHFTIDGVQDALIEAKTQIFYKYYKETGKLMLNCGCYRIGDNIIPICGIHQSIKTNNSKDSYGLLKASDRLLEEFKLYD